MARKRRSKRTAKAHHLLRQPRLRELHRQCPAQLPRCQPRTAADQRHQGDQLQPLRQRQPRRHRRRKRRAKSTFCSWALLLRLLLPRPLQLQLLQRKAGKRTFLTCLQRHQHRLAPANRLLLVLSKARHFPLPPYRPCPLPRRPAQNPPPWTTSPSSLAAQATQVIDTQRETNHVLSLQTCAPRKRPLLKALIAPRRRCPTQHRATPRQRTCSTPWRASAEHQRLQVAIWCCSSLNELCSQSRQNARRLSAKRSQQHQQRARRHQACLASNPFELIRCLLAAHAREPAMSDKERLAMSGGQQ